MASNVAVNNARTNGDAAVRPCAGCYRQRHYPRNKRQRGHDDWA